MGGRKVCWSNQQDTMFRHAAAYLASLGGYDDYGRPLCPIQAATEMVRGLAEALDMTVRDLTVKLDGARRRQWGAREKVGGTMRDAPLAAAPYTVNPRAVKRC